MNPSVRNIVFDWGGVLIDLDFEGCMTAFEEAGVTNIRQLVSVSKGSGIFSEYEQGLISTPQFRAKIRELAGIGFSDAEIDRMWDSILLSIPEEKLRLLTELSKRYHLFLLSNTNELHWLSASERVFRLDGFDVKQCFEGIFLSFRMNLSKPDPEIFRRAMRDAGLIPEETLFVDDAEVNCRAAASTGMQVLHYVPDTDLGKLFD
ncbi:HAD family phosphatase [uncultured Bacteroides sp.]|uniref:HAD family hydrolase n=1 Tax=uncultured Bacteroides sp. TaxID=162156 RepID=UPI0026026989|nr:HAD family phosphatase [uncultured Bacteroides sp.]